MKIYKLQVVYSRLDGVHNIYFSCITENQYPVQMIWIFFYLGKLFPNNYGDRFRFYPFDTSCDLFDEKVKVIVEYGNHLDAKSIAENIWKRIQKIVGYNNYILHYQDPNHSRVTMCGILSYNKVIYNESFSDKYRLCKKCNKSFRSRQRKVNEKIQN